MGGDVISVVDDVVEGTTVGEGDVVTESGLAVDGDSADQERGYSI